MAEPRQLKNPPIREAIIDFRVDLPAEVKIDALRNLTAAHRQAFPKVQERRKFHSEFMMRDDAAPEVRGKDLGTDGFLLRASADVDVLQFRMDGVAVNRLSPYQGWETLLAGARRALGVYSEAVKPLAITRISTRFINRILLPFPIAEVADYMTCPPQIPSVLPQHLSGFLSQIAVTDPETKIEARINQTCEVAKDGFLPWIVDIDAFCAGPLELDNPAIWQRLEELHCFKNRAFFGLITERTASLFL